MTVTAPGISDLDLFSDENLADPYPAYEVMRRQGPVCYLATHDIWAVIGYAEARAVLADWETFTSATGASFNEVMDQLQQGTFLAADPPRHDQLRAVFARGVSPRAVRSLRPTVTAKAAQFSDAAVKMGTLDAVADLAYPYPLEVIFDLIGFPPSLKDQLASWSDAGWQCIGPKNERFHQSLPLLTEMFDYLGSVTEDDFVAGGLASETFAAARSGELDPADVMPMLLNYTGPAMDTTVATLGHALLRFAQNPGVWNEIRDDIGLIPRAINEVLRIDSPVTMFGRRVTSDAVTIAGVPVPKHARVAVVYAAANHDPRHFSDPEVFDIHRRAADHLALGYGLHGCVGQGLARLEIQALLEQLADRVSRFHIVEPGPVRHLNNVVRSLQSLPLRIEAA